MPAPKSGGRGGKKNMDKGRQPKRKRYVSQQRGYKRRFKDLENHVAHNPNDAIAKDAVPRVKMLVTK